jgi:hypothetical protein
MTCRLLREMKMVQSSVQICKIYLIAFPQKWQRHWCGSTNLSVLEVTGQHVPLLHRIPTDYWFPYIIHRSTVYKTTGRFTIRWPTLSLPKILPLPPDSPCIMPSHILIAFTLVTLSGSQAIALNRSFLVAGIRRYRNNSISFLKQITSITNTLPMFGSEYKETKIYLLDYSEKAVVLGKQCVLFYNRFCI